MVQLCSIGYIYKRNYLHLSTFLEKLISSCSNTLVSHLLKTPTALWTCRNWPRQQHCNCTSLLQKKVSSQSFTTLKCLLCHVKEAFQPHFKKQSFENSFDLMIAYYHLWSSSISVAPNLLSFQVQFPLFPLPLRQTNIAQPTDSASPNSSVGLESSFVKVFKYAFHLFPLVLWLL